MQVTIEIADEKIADVLDAAHIVYWGDYADAGWAQACGAVMEGHKAHLYLLSHKEASISIEEEETHDEAQTSRLFKLNADGIEKALTIIADKWPWHLKAILAGEGDAETGDVLVQVAIFGDIIYG
jgi:hypothetical protein